jgi:hypothetical protein
MKPLIAYHLGYLIGLLEQLSTADIEALEDKGMSETEFESLKQYLRLLASTV